LARIVKSIDIDASPENVFNYVTNASAQPDWIKFIRAVDITAAVGPLEFAICLVHCDRTGAERAIERVLGELSERPAEVGLAVYPEDKCDGKALIELARGRAIATSVARQAA